MKQLPGRLYDPSGDERYMRTVEEAEEVDREMFLFYHDLKQEVEDHSARGAVAYSKVSPERYRSDLDKNAELSQLVDDAKRYNAERMSRDPGITKKDFTYPSHGYDSLRDDLQRKKISLLLNGGGSVGEVVDALEEWSSDRVSYVVDWLAYESANADDKTESYRDRIVKKVSKMQQDLREENTLLLNVAQANGRGKETFNGKTVMAHINQAVGVCSKAQNTQVKLFEKAYDKVNREYSEAKNQARQADFGADKSNALRKFFDMAKSVGFSLSNEVSKRPARSLAAAIGVGVVATTAIAGVGDVLDTYAERAALKKYHDFEVRTDRQVDDYYQSQINDALRSNEDTLAWFNSLHSNDILVNQIMEDAGYAYSHLSNEYVPAAGQDASTTASSPGSPSLQEWRGFYEAAMAQENTENIDDALQMVRHVHDQHVKASAMCAEDPGSEACAWDFETTGGRLFLADSQSQVAFDLVSGEMTAAIADPNAHVSGMSQDTIDVSIDEFFAYVTGGIENQSAFWEIQRNQERLEEIAMDSYWQKPGQPG